MIRWAVPAVMLTACSAPSAPAPPSSPITLQSFATDQNVPEYAKRPFEPFARANAVAIAQREWRLFGSVINDEPPGPDAPRDLRPDRQPGLWQRVGDYWWLSQNAGSRESGWTSRYDEFGKAYADIGPPWSAAFISYIMRAAGAGDRFAYSALHAAYINAAAQGEGIARAERPDTYAPQPGDLICFGRASRRVLRFEDLPAPSFYGHCDMVIDRQPGQLSVIGGNVVAGVTMKHVPTTPDGMLTGPDGQAMDGRYPWFVVLRVLYES